MFEKRRLPEGRLEERFDAAKPLYTHAEAVAEANRCLYCHDAPCIRACPTGIEIPTFIRKIATDNIAGSARTILSANILGYSCGKACPVEELCAGACVYNAWGREPIAIGRLQHFAVESALEKNPKLLGTPKPATGKKIACVGAGPASIALAGILALQGHSIVIFERKRVPGGLNTLGIAPYKMLADQAMAELEWVLALGAVELRTGIEVVAGTAGENQVAAEALLRDFDAVFLGLGLGEDSRLGISTEDGPGVEGAVALIERIKSDPDFRLQGVQRAVVVGGGNTAVDAARELARLGVSDVLMVYRRGRKDMSAYDHELEGARLDSVRVIESRVVSTVLRDGDKGPVKGVRLVEARDGRAVQGGASEEVPAELVVLAIGQNRATAIAKAFAGVDVDGKGRVVVDGKTHRTGNAKVWSGGDCVNGGKEVVNAAAEAKIAAVDIHRTLMGG